MEFLENEILYDIPTYHGQAIYLQLYLVGQMRESPLKQEMYMASFQFHSPSAICFFNNLNKI
jgi:hypothetical protein